jgi:FAD/FMN-containing dehydrogenase
MYSDPADGPEAEAEVAALGTRIYDGDGAYAGFLRDEGEARVRAAYPGGAYERLAAVKAEYDPDNVFRLNQNVAPA